MNQIFKAHVALIAANLFFGISYPIAKSLMPAYLQPIEIVLLRIAGSFFLFWIFHRIFYYERTDSKDIFKLALCGLFGVSANQLLFFEGLNFSTPIDASIIIVSNPIMVLIITAVAAKEKISTIKISGILLGSAGALITILYGKEHSSGTNPLLGNMMLFVNAACYALYLVLVKPLMAKYKPLTVMKWTFLFGGIFICPFCFNSFSEVNFAQFTIFTWAALAYVVVITTFLAYMLIAYSMKTVHATVASFYIYFQPIISGIISVLFLSEKIALIKVLAAIMIFAGVFMVSKSDQLKKGVEKE